MERGYQQGSSWITKQTNVGEERKEESGNGIGGQRGESGGGNPGGGGIGGGGTGGQGNGGGGREPRSLQVGPDVQDAVDRLKEVVGRYSLNLDQVVFSHARESAAGVVPQLLLREQAVVEGRRTPQPQPPQPPQPPQQLQQPQQMEQTWRKRGSGEFGEVGESPKRRKISTTLPPISALDAPTRYPSMEHYQQQQQQREQASLLHRTQSAPHVRDQQPLPSQRAAAYWDTTTGRVGGALPTAQQPTAQTRLPSLASPYRSGLPPYYQQPQPPSQYHTGGFTTPAVGQQYGVQTASPYQAPATSLPSQPRHPLQQPTYAAEPQPYQYSEGVITTEPQIERRPSMLRRAADHLRQAFSPRRSPRVVVGREQLPPMEPHPPPYQPPQPPQYQQQPPQQQQQQPYPRLLSQMPVYQQAFPGVPTGAEAMGGEVAGSFPKRGRPAGVAPHPPQQQYQDRPEMYPFAQQQRFLISEKDVPKVRKRTARGEKAGSPSGTSTRKTKRSDRPERQFPCDRCEATFKRKSDRNRHIRVVHLKDRPFLCTICSGAFGEKSNLYKHIRMVHQNIRSFHCMVCGFSFGQKGNLQSHMRSVHNLDPERLACNQCNMQFPTSEKLEEHIREFHDETEQQQGRRARRIEEQRLQQHERELEFQRMAASSHPMTRQETRRIRRSRRSTPPDSGGGGNGGGGNGGGA